MDYENFAFNNKESKDKEKKFLEIDEILQKKIMIGI